MPHNLCYAKKKKLQKSHRCTRHGFYFVPAPSFLFVSVLLLLALLSLTYSTCLKAASSAVQVRPGVSFYRL